MPKKTHGAYALLAQLDANRIELRVRRAKERLEDELARNTWPTVEAMVRGRIARREIVLQRLEAHLLAHQAAEGGRWLGTLWNAQRRDIETLALLVAPGTRHRDGAGAGGVGVLVVPATASTSGDWSSAAIQAQASDRERHVALSRATVALTPPADVIDVEVHNLPPFEDIVVGGLNDNRPATRSFADRASKPRCRRRTATGVADTDPITLRDHPPQQRPTAPAAKRKGSSRGGGVPSKSNARRQSRRPKLTGKE